MHAQFELDGQGALQVTGDSAVVTVFEFKSSLAGQHTSLSHSEAMTSRLVLGILSYLLALQMQQSCFVILRASVGAPNSASAK